MGADAWYFHTFFFPFSMPSVQMHFESMCKQGVFCLTHIVLTFPLIMYEILRSNFLTAVEKILMQEM